MPIRKAGTKLNDALGGLFNSLPDRANLFARYATRYGGDNLELDPSTLNDLRNVTAEVNRPFARGEETTGFDQKGNPIKFYLPGEPLHGPVQPRSGPVRPYSHNKKSVSNTLGRFMADVDEKENRLRFTDTYDMENESEDPDLVTGKFQPRKALNVIESIWNPAARQRNFKPDVIRRLPDKGYDANAVKTSGYSSTSSPMTQFGRALLYLSPIKPKPFDIDISVPLSGRIK